MMDINILEEPTSVNSSAALLAVDLDYNLLTMAEHIMEPAHASPQLLISYITQCYFF